MYIYKWLNNCDGWGIFSDGKRVFENERIRDREDLLIFLEKCAPCILIIQYEEGGEK